MKIFILTFLLLLFTITSIYAYNSNTNTWQYAKYNSSGTLLEIGNVPQEAGEPKAYPDYYKAQSGIEDGTTGRGFLYVVGFNLDSEIATEKVIRCVTNENTLIIHNISDSE